MNKREQLIEEMDRLLAYVSGINDERDSVPILLAARECWQQLRTELLNDDLSKAIRINGILTKKPLRELAELGLERPKHFINGVTIVRLECVRIMEAGLLIYGIFFECEPDAWYCFEPNKDTLLQLRGS